jgi:hypothetical protein
MTAYMVRCALPPEFSAEFISLIPAHRARVNELMREGKIIFYTLALDRSTVWAGVTGETEEEVQRTLATLPLQKFFDVTIHETAFMDVPGLSQLHFSLN